jgi:hypothetical protein
MEVEGIGEDGEDGEDVGKEGAASSSPAENYIVVPEKP